MIIRIFIISLAVIIVGCGSSIRQFYPDSFFYEDNVYNNKPLNFSLHFRGNWHIETDPNSMESTAKNFAKSLQKQYAELLFIGSTAEGTQGIRGIAMHLNAETLEYAQKIREINQKGITADSGLVEIRINTIPMVKWSYESTGFKFIEFFFTLDTYNIRIAFWSRPDIFKRFLPLYLTIMSSIEIINQW